MQSSEAVGQLPGNKPYFMCVRPRAGAYSRFWRKNMASIRTARVLAAVAALPLAAALFTGVATADNGAAADDGSNAAVATVSGSGTGLDNDGNSATTQQQALGSGASNQSNTAQVNGSAFTTINQGNENVAVHFTRLW